MTRKTRLLNSIPLTGAHPRRVAVDQGQVLTFDFSSTPGLCGCVHYYNSSGSWISTELIQTPMARCTAPIGVEYAKVTYLPKYK